MSIFKLIQSIVTKSVSIQLILTLASIPILIGWGLPLSLASILGNLFFTPFLMIFMVISSLLFFANLCNIPHAPLVYTLNWFTDYWHTFLSFGKTEWLVYSWCPSTPVLILMLVIIFIVLRFVMRKVLTLVLLLAITCVGIYAMHKVQRAPGTEQIAANLSIQCDDKNALTLIDYGFLSKKKSLKSYVEFELKPMLAKRYGTIHITKLLLLRPTNLCINRAQELQKYLPVDNITQTRTRAHTLATGTKDF